jgi:hypothetical protein
MSHITRVKTSMKDGAVLQEVLQKAGYRVEKGGLILGDARKTRGMPVEIIAEKKGVRIGFSRDKSSEGAYEIVADWAMQVSARKTITAEILQDYSREKVMKLAGRKGYSVIQNRRNQRGQIEIVLRKVA